MLSRLSALFVTAAYLYVATGAQVTTHADGGFHVSGCMPLMSACGGNQVLAILLLVPVLAFIVIDW